MSLARQLDPNERPFSMLTHSSATSGSRRRLHSRCAHPCSLRSRLAEVRRSRQRCFGLGDESAHNFAYRQDFIDASGCLARREQTLMLTACLGRRDDLTPQAIAIATRLLALAVPLIQESCWKRAQDRVETGCAWKRADVIENINLYRVLRLGSCYRLLPLLWGGSFRGGNEPRTEINPDRAEHERRRNAAPVEDAAGRDDGNGRHCVNDLGYECHRTDLASVTARLAALRDDYVDTSLSRMDGLRNRRYLQHHERADIVDLPHQIARMFAHHRAPDLPTEYD